MHKEVDWRGINDAADWIGDYLVRWGRVGVTQTKEKYGTVRVYLSFGFQDFHSITHPTHHFNRYPKWLRNLDFYVGRRLMSIINPIVIPYHGFLYKRAYSLALKKWPHLAREILVCADYLELLKDLKEYKDAILKYRDAE